jgi:TatD DNase family protein
LDLGCFISFAGNVTFKNARDLQDVARRIPGEAILVETDAPYLAPHPLRGRPNQPGLIAYTYARIAELRSIPVEELVATVHDNFLRAFRLDATRPE